MANLASAQILVRLGAVTRLALGGRALESIARVTAEAGRGAVLAGEQLGVIGVLFEEDALPVVDGVAGVAGGAGAAVRLAVAVGAGHGLCDVRARGVTRGAGQIVVADEREAVLGGGVPDGLPAARVVAELARGSERTLVVPAIAVAAMAIERDPGPLARPAAGRVTALARDRLVPSGERKAGLRVVDRRFGVGAQRSDEETERDEETDRNEVPPCSHRSGATVHPRLVGDQPRAATCPADRRFALRYAARPMTATTFGILRSACPLARCHGSEAACC